MTIAELEERIGSLSNPSKMPGYAWGISALECHTGGKLRKVAGSICEKCYAMKGRYNGKNVSEAHWKRLQAWYRDPFWVDHMSELIKRRTRKVKYFRWFDSGDLQGLDMLNDIVQVCRNVPDVHFWMSTREQGLIRSYLREGCEFPANLIIRVSAAMINGSAPNWAPYTSIVKSKDHRDQWDLISGDFFTGGEEPDRFICPAPLQQHKCGDCRACWNKNYPEIAYLEH